MEPPEHASDEPLPRWAAALGLVPEPDASAEPDGFVVLGDTGNRVHFLDWDGPGVASESSAPLPGVLLVHGIAQTAWGWTPVARRLRRVAHVVAMDLRGHGLSDSPVDGYDADTLGEDVVAVAEGSGLLGPTARAAGALPAVVLAGHGFGAIVAVWGAAALGDRCAGLVLVDGGWERVEETIGLDVDEFLRTIDEPPEVLASMTAYLADRRAFDPATWDADQEHAARATVVETAAGRVVPATRPHALAACVWAMYDYDPEAALGSLDVPTVALSARDDTDGRRRVELDRVQQARLRSGRDPIEVIDLVELGHNLPRYRPAVVGAAILGLAVAGPRRHGLPGRRGTIAGEP